jgi:hypothetical protein
MKKSVGNQCHQYQQNEQSPLLTEQEYLLCFIYHIYNGRLKTSRIFAMLYLLYIQRKIEDILVEWLKQ